MDNRANKKHDLKLSLPPIKPINPRSLIHSERKINIKKSLSNKKIMNEESLPKLVKYRNQVY